ncbi:MAG: hypothetical protein R3191_05960 [Anaerolineales bacterium]|nr:hypothetical protein [Anaerolineales bacterium]
MSKKLILGLLGVMLLSSCAGPAAVGQLEARDPAATITVFKPPT